MIPAATRCIFGHLSFDFHIGDLAMDEKRINIEINVPAIALTACIWAPGSITMQELRAALVSQLRLDPSYRVLEVESDGARSVLNGAEVLKDVIARSKEFKFYLKPETAP